MHKNRSAGFTLIELLVVIAIIGILSAVVLASLSTARNKGSDAAVQSDLSTIQTQAEIYYGGTGGNSYAPTTLTWTASCSAAAATNMFGGDTTIHNAILGADSANSSGSVGCAATASTYVIAAQMVNNTANYWCVDSNGKSESAAGTVATMGAITQCP